MSVLARMMSSRLSPSAAAMAAALAVTGCVAPEHDEPEPVAEVEQHLGETRQVKLGLVQLVSDSNPEVLMGYGYIEPDADQPTTHSLQRWLILSNPPGNTLRIRAYNAAYDPPQVGTITADMEGWEDLVDALWIDGVENDFIYAMCVSKVYKQGQTYDHEPWRVLPDVQPAPTYPVWSPSALAWQAFTPDLHEPAQPSPLVWPPTNAWVQDNALPPLYQLDPGDGKLFQYTVQDEGDFFVVDGVTEEFSVEYFRMTSSYLQAGTELTATRIVGDDGAPNYGSDSQWWDAMETAWDTGDQMAINGCINHKGSKPGQL